MALQQLEELPPPIETVREMYVKQLKASAYNQGEIGRFLGLTAPVISLWKHGYHQGDRLDVTWRIWKWCTGTFDPSLPIPGYLFLDKRARPPIGTISLAATAAAMALEERVVKPKKPRSTSADPGDGVDGGGGGRGEGGGSGSNSKRKVAKRTYPEEDEEVGQEAGNDGAEDEGTTTRGSGGGGGKKVVKREKARVSKALQDGDVLRKSYDHDDLDSIDLEFSESEEFNNFAVWSRNRVNGGKGAKKRGQTEENNYSGSSASGSAVVGAGGEAEITSTTAASIILAPIGALATPEVASRVISQSSGYVKARVIIFGQETFETVEHQSPPTIPLSKSVPLASTSSVSTRSLHQHNIAIHSSAFNLLYLKPIPYRQLYAGLLPVEEILDVRPSRFQKDDNDSGTKHKKATLKPHTTARQYEFLVKWMTFSEDSDETTEEGIHTHDEGESSSSTTANTTTTHNVGSQQNDSLVSRGAAHWVRLEDMHAPSLLRSFYSKQTGGLVPAEVEAQIASSLLAEEESVVALNAAASHNQAETTTTSTTTLSSHLLPSVLEAALGALVVADEMVISLEINVWSKEDRKRGSSKSDHDGVSGSSVTTEAAIIWPEVFHKINGILRTPTLLASAVCAMKSSTGSSSDGILKTTNNHETIDSSPMTVANRMTDEDSLDRRMLHHQHRGKASAATGSSITSTTSDDWDISSAPRYLQDETERKAAQRSDIMRDAATPLQLVKTSRAGTRKRLAKQPTSVPSTLARKLKTSISFASVIDKQKQRLLPSEDMESSLADMLHGIPRGASRSNVDNTVGAATAAAAVAARGPSNASSAMRGNPAHTFRALWLLHNYRDVLDTRSAKHPVADHILGDNPLCKPWKTESRIARGDASHQLYPTQLPNHEWFCENDEADEQYDDPVDESGLADEAGKSHYPGEHAPSIDVSSTESAAVSAIPGWNDFRLLPEGHVNLKHIPLQSVGLLPPLIQPHVPVAGSLSGFAIIVRSSTDVAFANATTISNSEMRVRDLQWMAVRRILVRLREHAGYVRAVDNAESTSSAPTITTSTLAEDTPSTSSSTSLVEVSASRRQAQSKGRMSNSIRIGALAQGANPGAFWVWGNNTSNSKRIRPVAQIVSVCDYLLALGFGSVLSSCSPTSTVESILQTVDSFSLSTSELQPDLINWSTEQDIEVDDIIYGRTERRRLSRRSSEIVGDDEGDEENSSSSSSSTSTTQASGKPQIYRLPVARRDMIPAAVIVMREKHLQH